MYTAANGRTAGLAKLQCRIGILVHEYLFNTHFIRRMFTDNINDATEDSPETFRQGLALCADTATGHITQLLPLLVYDPVTRDTGAGINTEDTCHALQYSIIASLPQLLQDLFGNICIGIHVLDIIKIFQVFQQANHLFGIIQFQW